MSPVNYEKYVGETVQLYTLVPIFPSYEMELPVKPSADGEAAGKKKKRRRKKRKGGIKGPTRRIEAEAPLNILKGEVVSGSPDHIELSFDKRGRTHTYHVPANAIGFIHTTKLNEIGKRASERAKSRVKKMREKKAQKAE